MTTTARTIPETAAGGPPTWRWISVWIAGTLAALMIGAQGPLGLMLWGPVSEEAAGVEGPLLGGFMAYGVIEAIGFGAGITWLVFLRSMLRSGALNAATYLAVGWLLTSWLPHGALHQTMAHDDFETLLRVEFGFHVTLMVAGAIAGAFVWTRFRSTGAISSRARIVVAPTWIAAAVFAMAIGPHGPLGGFWGETDPAASGVEGALRIGFSAYAIIEAIAFGAGVAWLVVMSPMARAGVRNVLTYLAVAWLLISWLPHGALHQTWQPGDYAQLLGIEFGFHVTLLVAGAVVGDFVWRALVRERVS